MEHEEDSPPDFLGVEDFGVSPSLPVLMWVKTRSTPLLYGCEIFHNITWGNLTNQGDISRHLVV